MSPSKLALRNSYQKNIIKYSRADFKTANPMVLASWHRRHGINSKHANPVVSELSNRESLDRHT